MEGCDYKEPQGNFWENMCVHFLDCGHNFTSINIYQVIQLYILNVWPKVCQSYLNKIVKSKTYLTKEDTQMIYKHMKNSPTSYNYHGNAI